MRRLVVALVAVTVALSLAGCGGGGEDEAAAPETAPAAAPAVAAAAYAGIPLTHRKLTATLAFVTGHEDPHKETSSIDWESLGRGIGTLVFLMGVKNLPQITGSLIQHGKPDDTPVALVRWGTARPTQSAGAPDPADRLKLHEQNQQIANLVARLPLMVRPSAPRFLNFGDQFELPAGAEPPYKHNRLVRSAGRQQCVQQLALHSIRSSSTLISPPQVRPTAQASAISPNGLDGVIG